MTVLVLALSLLFGSAHVYGDGDSQNVGIMFGCTAGDPTSSGFEFVGPEGPGPYTNLYDC